jgi:hypothetical protein
MSGITKEMFNEKFGDMMLNGLDSQNTYIPLRTNARYGINVAIRPRVIRASAGVVLFGGTLRVGYTLDSSHDPIKTSVTDISDEVRVQRLKDFCKGFSWQKRDEKRFSTIIGVGIAGGQFDQESVIQAIEENEVARDFINRLERTYKQYNDVSFGNLKATAIEALHAAWILQTDNPKVFKPLVEVTPLPEGVAGKQGPVLNTAQDKYQDNVISFQQKVEELVEATKEDSV